jgi:DNA-binding XRE family transcriptional regulator
VNVPGTGSTFGGDPLAPYVREGYVCQMAAEIPLTLGAIVRQRRIALGLNQTELGRLIGASQTSVSVIELDIVDLSWSRLRALRAALDLHLGDLDQVAAA